MMRTERGQVRRDDADERLLDIEQVLPYLADRGIVRHPGQATAVALSGGVSNVVLRVTDPGHDVVVKQSRARLRVRDEWYAPRERVLTEADALTLVRDLTPTAVPRVLDRDEARNAIVLEHAPADWVDWKSRLLSGVVDPLVAERLAAVLAAWHGGTSTVPLREVFADTVPFEQLRVSPYYRTVAARRPALAEPIQEYIEAMGQRRMCLVHGDFSPKNVLVGGAGELWVIDFEVAHLGDPAFDLAFLLCHLTMKALHVPAAEAELDECVGRFTATYENLVPEPLRPIWSYVLGHVGCLLLARVDGKSPAEYLTDAERQAVRAVGSRLLTDPPDRVTELAAVRRNPAL